MCDDLPWVVSFELGGEKKTKGAALTFVCFFYMCMRVCGCWDLCYFFSVNVTVVIVILHCCPSFFLITNMICIPLVIALSSGDPMTSATCKRVQTEVGKSSIFENARLFLWLTAAPFSVFHNLVKFGSFWSAGMSPDEAARPVFQWPSRFFTDVIVRRISIVDHGVVP